MMGWEDKGEYKLTKGEQIQFPNDTANLNEYLTKVGIGANIHKYAGLWTLGLDLLPTQAQRSLNFFVYRGCTCKIDAWFKNPLTSKPLVPEPIYNENNEDKVCLKRSTKQKLFKLYNINKEGKLISFIILGGNKINNGRIKLLDDNNQTIFELNFKENSFEFESFESKYGKWRDNYLKIVDHTTSGNIMEILLIVDKYFILIDINNLNNYFYPNNWTEGNFLNKSENVNFGISGDFVIISPVLIGPINGNDKISTSMPYKIKNNEIQSKSVTFHFHCFVNSNAEYFYLKLMSGLFEENNYVGRTFYGLKVNFTENKIIAYSTIKYAPELTLQNSIFKKGKPFECSIVLREYRGLTTINNESKYANMMDGNITIIEHYIKENKIVDHQIYKKKMKELKGNGTIVCLEGNILGRDEMIKTTQNYIAIYLLHVSYGHNFHEYEGALILDFKFNPNKYMINKNIGGSSKLKMFSMIRGGPGINATKRLKNPIGQTGVPISILIYADLDYFNISINGEGAISDLKFYEYDQNLSTCPTLIKKFPIFKLPKNVLKLEHQLVENEEIIIIGKIIKPFRRIKINFLHGALQVHTIFGQTVFQLKITKDCSYNFLFLLKYLISLIKRMESKGKIPIPFTATEYIQVLGLINLNKNKFISIQSISDYNDDD
ncbi:hypothetical protein Mgra_00009227 [Meloidogyne graminicola]|uniref:Galectin n=1 Tax=Meloidogyne graminicola TaxID=189291 RepID=A0A8S9ZDH9_9BILA|nr:hypothetical protein Mgra_00009227 [Meloidogyne graminicola]